MPQELGVLPGIDVHFHTTAVCRTEGGGEVDSKAFSPEYVITHQHIHLQSVNQMQLAVDGYVDLIAIFVNTRDVDCCQGKVS